MLKNGKRLQDRVLVITGAGRGIGREYALLAAQSGAKIVVNDLGSSLSGERNDESPAAEVVREIIAAGGEAIADSNDVSDWDGADALISKAISTWGKLDGLINNAGILRDRMLVNMTPEEWDVMMKVHLRGHFCTARRAASHWRERAKVEGPLDAVLISTSSVSALHGAIGQTNYATAKAGLATFALLCHRELNEKYGVRSYGIAPGARTRLTTSTPHAAKSVGLIAQEGVFDFADPANVAPFVVWLNATGCPAPSGTVYGVSGDKIEVYQPWTIAETFRAGGHRWTFDALDGIAENIVAAAPRMAETIIESVAKEKLQA